MKIFSLQNKQFVDWDLFWATALELREDQINASINPDQGLIRLDQMMRQSLEEDAHTPKGRIKTMILPKKEVQTLADKARPQNRKINVDQMRDVLAQVYEAIKDTGQFIMPANENWLGDGFIGIGTPEEFGSSSCAYMNDDGSITTIFGKRGLLSRMKTHHWVSSIDKVARPIITIYDENYDILTPGGEIWTSRAFHKQRLLFQRGRVLINRPINSARIISQSGLKGVTVPINDLGVLNWNGHEFVVHAIAGPNSMKGGTIQAKIAAWQLKNWQPFSLKDHQHELDDIEILEGEWIMPNGTVKHVKFGLEFIYVTEMTDEFGKVGLHRMGTEVVRAMDYAGNKEFVSYLRAKTHTYDELIFRQMLGEIPPPEDIPPFKRPRYRKSHPWQLGIRITDPDRLPFNDNFSILKGRLVPSKEYVMSFATELDDGSFILPTWAAAFAGYIVNYLSGRPGSAQRLESALQAALSGKRGVTRKALRPLVKCLQGKQVALRSVLPGEIATTNSDVWERKVLTIRYPLLWNIFFVSKVRKAPRKVESFQLDLGAAKGLVFRNVDDMLWEQSDADGDVCFNYLVPSRIADGIVEVASKTVMDAKVAYTDKEVDPGIKEKSISVVGYHDVLRELLTASQNKTLMGTATMDLWKLEDHLWKRIPDSDAMEIIDVAAFYIQDAVVRGIKHESHNAYDASQLLALLMKTFPRYAPIVRHALFNEQLDETMARLCLSYVEQALLVQGDDWFSCWCNEVLQSEQDSFAKDMIQLLLEVA